MTIAVDLGRKATKQKQAFRDLERSGPEVIKLFSCSTQLNMLIILLINVKMPTIVGILSLISMINTTSERLKARNFFICRYFVGILTFISMINTTSERLKDRNFFICRYFSFYDQLKFCARLS